MKRVLDARLKINEETAEMVVGLFIQLKMVEKVEELLLILTVECHVGSFIAGPL